MGKLNNILKKNYRSIVYTVKQAHKCDKILLPLMFLNMLFDATTPFIAVIFPQYIIDELTIGRNQRNAVLMVVLFVLSDWFMKSINAALDGIVNCKKEKLIQQHYRVFSTKTMTMDLEDIEKPSISDRKTRAQQVITWNSRNIDGIKNALGGMVSYSLQIIGYIYILSKLNAFIILFLIAVVCVNTVLDNVSQKAIRKNDIELTPINREWNYLSNLADDYSYGKLVRIYDLTELIIDKCKGNRKKYKEKQLKIYKLNFTNKMLLSCLSLLQEGMIYVFLAVSAVKGEITLGELTMYVTAAMAFTKSINNLVSFTIGLNYTSEYVNDFIEFINLPDSMEKSGSAETGDNDFCFEFRNVSFKYPQTEEYILKNINIKFDSKEQVMLVGENGAGKTTFIKLLMRFYDPTSGEILLNGKNIKEYNYYKYLDVFSVVFQDFQLFDFTISENIAFQKMTTKYSQKEQRITDALRSVGMLEKIYSMPKGIHTDLGKSFEEDGIELSGGERQKIAIARAIYKNAETFIMDEPAANLSPIAEYNIFKHVSNATKKKMVLYISHRLTGSIFSKRILVFKDGSIIEEGSHQQLMKHDGFYKKMFSLQSAYYLDGEVNADE